MVKFEDRAWSSIAFEEASIEKQPIIERRAVELTQRLKREDFNKRKAAAEVRLEMAETEEKKEAAREVLRELQKE